MSPADIECPKYEPVAGSRRCSHYLDNGACARPDEVMCVEWLKRNGHPLPRPTRETPQPCVEERAGTERDRPQMLAVRQLSDEALESFRALGLEVCLSPPDSRAVWIVPEYSGRERLELRVDHAATLAVLCSALPGARVTQVRRSGEDGR